MKKTKYYIASCSCGKDSIAMVLKLLALGYPLTHVIFYNTGMEFDAILNNWKKLVKILEEHGVITVHLQPETSFLMQMLINPVNKKDGSIGFGYDWCGGVCRWRTTDKVVAIKKFLDSLDGDYIQYIGYAVDEPDRVNNKLSQIGNKRFPLVELNMTEADCLQYCYDNGFDWMEDGVELYSILKRVSCWCCKNKNLEELRNIYHFLPRYWGYLKGLQSRIDRPFYTDKTIFELEERFKLEDAGKWKIRKCKKKKSTIQVKTTIDTTVTTTRTEIYEQLSLF